MNLTAEPISRHPELTAAWYQDNRLQESAGSVFLLQAFLDPLLTHLAGEHTRLLVGWEHGSPRVILPVEPAGFGRWRSFYASQMPVTPLLANALSIDRPFLKQAARALGGVVAMLTLYDFDHDTFPGVSLPGENAIPVPYADTFFVDLGDGFDAYWKSRSKNLRSNVRRYGNRAGKAGIDFTFRTLHAPQDVSEGLARYAEIERQGWKGEQGTAIDPETPQGAFYADALSRFAAQGDAFVFELLHGDSVIASRLVIRHGNVATILKTTYREDYAEYAPGRLHLHETLAQIGNAQLARKVEFFTKMTREQASWSTTARAIEHLELYPSALARRLNALRRRL